jgi:hypothetical protein
LQDRTNRINGLVLRDPRILRNVNSNPDNSDSTYWAIR